MSSEDGAGTPYKLRGLGKWLQNGAQSVNPVPSDFRTDTGSIHGSGVFTETVLNNLITNIYRETGTTESLTLVADTALRRKISDFARFGGLSSSGGEMENNSAVRRVSYMGNEATITLSVEMYQSDHGMVSIVNMNPDCAPDTSKRTQDISLTLSTLVFLSYSNGTSLPNLGAGE